tara:strand:- start:277 stop:2217 length:1941 start_codon:yes stop_codon:yes gene_type:complete
MALDKSDVIGSIFSGWWEADKADSAQRLKIRNEELANKQNTIKTIKTNNYNDEIADYKKKKVVIDSLNSVAANNNNKMYTDDLQLGEAVLRAKHGDKFAEFKKSMTGAEGDLTDFYKIAQREGLNFRNTGVDGTNVKKNFKEKSVIEAEYIDAITKIEEETKAALEAAAGDSKTVNAIVNLKNKLIGEIKPNNSKVETIDSVNETMSTKNGYPNNEKDKLKEVQTTISTGEKETETDTDTDIATEVKALEATGTIPLFIPKSWKDKYTTKYDDAQKIDFSSKEYTKKISDTVLTLIPDAKTKDYFVLDKDNKITSALPSITNADVTIQSLMNGSLDDVDMQSTFKETGKNSTKIDFSANKRFNMAKNHVEAYGVWMADGKVLGDEGSLKNLFKKTSTALVVPANSIINLNTGELKGYSRFGSIPSELKKGVGSTYKNFIVAKANERMEKEGGSLEENINALQRIIEQDNNGSEALTQEARDVIANALSTAKKGDGSLYYEEIINEIQKEKNKGKATSSTMDMKQEEMANAMIGNVRTVKVNINGKEQIVPLTTKNKAILKANNITIPDIEQEPTAGDGSVMEQVASETDTKRITPQDAGLEADSNFFTSLDSVKAILPNDMSGKEIKEKYNIDFNINDNTIYKPII